MAQTKILITGANGQIGRVLTEELRKIYGTESILATDITKLPITVEPFEFLDILNAQRSVSYTHLDVYKRQDLFFPCWLSFLLLTPHD